MFNFVTVCTEKYSVDYANKTLNMFSRNCNLFFTPYCITDKSVGLDERYVSIQKNDNFQGWWNKISLFDDRFLHDFTVYLDLDVLIQNNLDKVINFAFERDCQMACFADHISWHGTRFGSALMIFKPKSLNHIFKIFQNEYSSLLDFKGGDQVWLSQHLQDILYLDDHFENLVKSIKFDIAQTSKVENGNLKIDLPGTIAREIMLLNFHGFPKPHDVPTWEPVVRLWR